MPAALLLRSSRSCASWRATRSRSTESPRPPCGHRHSPCHSPAPPPPLARARDAEPGKVAARGLAVAEVDDGADEVVVDLVAIVVAANVGLMTETTKLVVDDCSRYQAQLSSTSTPSFRYDPSCQQYGGDFCPSLTVSPASANASIYKEIEGGYNDFESLNVTLADDFVKTLKDKESWLSYMQNQTGFDQKGIYFGSGQKDNPPIIAYQYIQYISEPTGAKLLNIWHQAAGNIEIDTRYGALPTISKSTQIGAWVFAMFIALIQAAYPAFFVVYPAIERRSNTRSLQYANGVRRTPQMVAYILFDFLWILVMSVVSTIALIPITGWIGIPWLMILVFTLYGICGNFISQIVSHVSNGPLKSFLAALTVNLICFAVGFGTVYGTLAQPDKVISGVAWGLGFFLPMANLVRALLVGLNGGGLGCTNGIYKTTGAMDAYGGPILYLVLQVIWLGILSVWVDGGLPYIPFLHFFLFPFLSLVPLAQVKIHLLPRSSRRPPRHLRKPRPQRDRVAAHRRRRSV
ncbi:hypothetical protein NLG97_g2156 [Lecanicillium saksenae]|uniref:Uncharacterized protein n=1 Tax=Lecanicillium saksenae TaxID=468837 RepID=A0ACC1R548_9HYPO|nr:hypothetical protein NLG97_g2156 [Lecanicillium saksenae]